MLDQLGLDKALVAALGAAVTLAPDSVRAMFDRIAPVYDVMNRVMTAGLDMRWRNSPPRLSSGPATACSTPRAAPATWRSPTRRRARRA